MADVTCPMCGKANPEELDECQFCGARLKPVIAASSDDSPTIKPGEEPVKRNTSELEKINLKRGAPIRPGDAPTKKNTAELERALPSWLRDLRGGNPPAAGESMAEPSAQDDASAAGQKPAASGDSTDWLSGLSQAASEEEQVPDWLAGLRGSQQVESAPAPASDEGELSSGLGNADWMSRLGNEPQQPAPEPAGMGDTPDWLKGLQSSTPASQAPSGSEPPLEPTGAGDTPDWLKGLQSSTPASQAPAGSEPPPEPTAAGDTPDWLKGLQSSTPASQAPAGSEPPPEPTAAGDTPDWLKGLQSSSPAGQALPGSEPPPEPTAAGDTPDWLKGLQSSTPASQAPAGSEPPPEPRAAGDTPDWLKGLQPAPSDAQATPPVLQGADNLPEWLSGLPDIAAQSGPSPAEAVEPEPAEMESMPDWMDQLKQKASPSEPTPPAWASDSVPDWLSSSGDSTAAPAPSAAGNVPDWLANLQEKSKPADETPGTVFSAASNASANQPVETPDWLSQLQGQANAGQESQQKSDNSAGIPPEPSSPKETGPLPEWLKGIEPAAPFSTGAAPALIGDSKDNPPAEPGQAAFPTETPDWLSKLSPEQAAEKPAVPNEDQAETDSLDVSELPSWVQAMRPVEAVVEEKSALVSENKAAEVSGPLAGLRGVLPSGPGLGLLRKPPAYSTKILVSEGQQRYASTFGRLIAGEMTPREIKTTRLSSSQWLHWLIAVILLLAVGLPLLFGANTNSVQNASEISFASDQGASAKIVDGLPTNVPVLVAFDYDPALSGELEAVAAPLMDRLLSKGVPLALISTSPTGPILAEHFLQTTPLISDYKYQNGNQYINLGYLAGGPAGISYFADKPTEAMQFTLDGQAAWGTGPLQGIQKLGDFAAVIILTDNADTGRDWIEQAGPRLVGGSGANIPMLMVISAQAEPMIRPYLDSKQIQGMVSGLSDARFYEQSNASLGATHQFGLDNQYWNSFGVGMLVAELLIFVGVILSVLTDWRARHKNSGEEA